MICRPNYRLDSVAPILPGEPPISFGRRNAARQVHPMLSASLASRMDDFHGRQVRLAEELIPACLALADILQRTLDIGFVVLGLLHQAFMCHSSTVMPLAKPWLPQIENHKARRKPMPAAKKMKPPKKLANEHEYIPCERVHRLGFRGS